MAESLARLGPGSDRDRLYRRARLLAIVTIVYNLLEGLVSVAFGVADGSLTLLGFGIDSFVEVLSGLGIWHMIARSRSRPETAPDRFERTALGVTAVAFFVLAAGLVATAAASLYLGRAPTTTVAGAVIALISIATMGWLMTAKRRVGEGLGSDAVIADAHCTRACLELSLVLLIASLAYELTGVAGLDAAGALMIAWIAGREGRESWQKARGRPGEC